MSKKKLILLGILAIFMGFLIGGGFFVVSTMNKLDRESISTSNEDLGIDEDLEKELNEKNSDVKNIALFGIDQEEESKERGRSDAIMILTVDDKHNKLKLSSIMRDSYVNIDGKGQDKINHAYAYGGPELAIKTINQNFNLNIKDYATVNFSTLPKIIDVVGGIEIDIKDYEVSRAGVSNAGLQTLNGEQALKYSRIRYAGNGDFERTERQRTVLMSLFDKVKSRSLSSNITLANEILPMVKTNLSNSKIIGIGTDVLTNGSIVLETERFPKDGYHDDQKIDGVYYLAFDEEATIQQMHDYIFEDKK
ncbi:LCP family protein [Clostridium sp. D2Q-14]|uniref:LCP family protein n=1 Tax=Anaeromonas gelatinilytica TaxID=2683194 RepID=UPI00193B2483|nr:LCP family protein [Anaeromonas gelatinilytica]MBS4536641.1 LCP family protein [Anaeromonas gelatinilytica]